MKGREARGEGYCKGRDLWLPGGRGQRYPPPKEDPLHMDISAMEKDGFPPLGIPFWRGRLGRGNPKGETKAGEERHGSLPLSLRARVGLRIWINCRRAKGQSGRDT